MPKLRAPAPTPTRAQLLTAVRLLIPPADYDEAVRTLDLYPPDWARSYVKEIPERVQMAVLGMSGGTLDGLRRHIAEAVNDYRSVLAAYSMKPYSAVHVAIDTQLGVAGLSPWAEWLAEEKP